jgi:hypothetical protein
MVRTLCHFYQKRQGRTYEFLAHFALFSQVPFTARSIRSPDAQPDTINPMAAGIETNNHPNRAC